MAKYSHHVLDKADTVSLRTSVPINTEKQTQVNMLTATYEKWMSDIILSSGTKQTVCSILESFVCSRGISQTDKHSALQFHCLIGMNGTELSKYKNKKGKKKKNKSETSWIPAW